MISRKRQAILAATATVTALLAGCGTGADTSGDTTRAGAASVQQELPHGYVPGAQEAAEAQSRLVLADAGTGEVRVVDLITEQVVGKSRAEGVERVSGDGRFTYLTTGQSVRILDSGAWTVDHGDHSHYYSADVRDVGTIDGAPVAGAHSDPVLTAVAADGGGTTLLDRPALEKGTVTEHAAMPEATVVPYEEHLLVAAPGAGQERPDGIEVRTRDERTVTPIAEACPDLEGWAVTRRGAVFGCADGALLVSENDGTFSGEKIPYPGQVAESERAREFRHRAGSATLAAKAGQRGVWQLDVSAKEWTLFETGPVAAVNTVGAGAPLLTLTGDGVLHAYDTETAEEIAQTPLLAEPPPDDAAAPVIHVDTSRAYVNDPSARAVHEIDYNDDLRIARSITVDIAPTHMAVTGR